MEIIRFNWNDGFNGWIVIGFYRGQCFACFLLCIHTVSVYSIFEPLPCLT